MAKKTTAKRKFGKSDRYRAWPDGFEFFHKPQLPITDKQARKIATSLGVEIESDHVAAVFATIRRFDGREASMAELPQGDHRTQDIETLAALARAMEGLNLNVLARLARHGVDLGDSQPEHVMEAARLAVEDIERTRPRPKPGPRRMDSREIVLRELAANYEATTGRKAKLNTTSGSDITEAGRPSGPFFRFIRAAIAPVPSLKKLKDDALAQAIRRATARTRSQ